MVGSAIKRNVISVGNTSMGSTGTCRVVAAADIAAGGAPPLLILAILDYLVQRRDPVAAHQSPTRRAASDVRSSAVR